MKSASRRKIYVVGGGIIGVLSFGYGLANVYNSNVDSTVFILIGLGCLIAMGVNIVRIRQIKEFSVYQPCPKPKEAE